MFRYFIASLLLVAISMAYGCKKPKPEASEPKPKYEFRLDGNLDVIANGGKVKASFEIEIVQKEEELMQGLKFRETMAANRGMLFIFAYEDYHAFWMQDTYLPLDMLFIAKDGTIVQIHENAQPFSEERITPTELTSFVLELNAGTAKHLNLKTGDKIVWKRLP